MNAELEELDISIDRCEPVVVHMKSGTLVKGFLQCNPPQQSNSSPGGLPDVLTIVRAETKAPSTVHLADVKAVFFVRTHDGNGEHREVKFFAEEDPTELWVQLRLHDGEMLEGRVVNSIDLLLAPGLWVLPTDSIANNSLVYAPKTSVVEFRVIGLAPVVEV